MHANTCLPASFNLPMQPVLPMQTYHFESSLCLPLIFNVPDSINLGFFFFRWFMVSSSNFAYCWLCATTASRARTLTFDLDIWPWLWLLLSGLIKSYFPPWQWISYDAHDCTPSIALVLESRGLCNNFLRTIFSYSSSDSIQATRCTVALNFII